MQEWQSYRCLRTKAAFAAGSIIICMHADKEKFFPHIGDRICEILHYKNRCCQNVFLENYFRKSEWKKNIEKWKINSKIHIDDQHDFFDLIIFKKVFESYKNAIQNAFFVREHIFDLACSAFFLPGFYFEKRFLKWKYSKKLQLKWHF